MKVLVYGTLKRGGALHGHLRDAKLLGEVTTPREYTMHNLGWYPGVKKEGTTAIKGEVYEINDDILRRLDVAEGYPSLYGREEIDTEHGKAWIYLYNGTPAEGSDIPSGEWTIR